MNQERIEEILKAKNMLEEIEKRFNNNEELNNVEIEKLGLSYKINNNQDALSDPRFEYVVFRHLYLVYAKDLSFDSKFFKINPEKNISNYLDFKTLQELNRKDYDSNKLNAIELYLKEEKVLIEVPDHQVQKDIVKLENIAKKWANICLVENSSSENLKVITKETRDTLKKKKIEDYLIDGLDQNVAKEVFKGLLKSYYIFNEAQKITDKIDRDNETRFFEINGYKIELNFYTLIHILNRHFAEIISSQNIAFSKSFHIPKIDPYNIHNLINELFEGIKSRNLENKIIEDDSILFQFHNIDYALFFKKYKYNNKKTVFETLFVIEEGNENARRLTDRIEVSTSIKLADNLYYYNAN